MGLALGIGLTAAGVGAAASAASTAKGAHETKKELNDQASAMRRLAETIGIDLSDLNFTFANPNLGNAVLSGASAATLQQLGMPIGNALRQGGPMGNLQNAAGASGLGEDEFREISNDIGKLYSKYRNLRNRGLDHKTASTKAKKQINKGGVLKASRLAGFGSLGEFLDSQYQYEDQSDAFEAEAARLQPEIQAGRMSAMQAIAQLQQDFPIPTAENLRALEQRVISERFRDVDKIAGDQRELALEQANAFGLNPAGILGEIAEAVTHQKGDIQDVDALQRAIALMGGQQSLAAQSMGTLSGSLNAPIAAAQGLAGIFGNGQAAQGQLALGRDTALNSTRVNALLESERQRLATLGAAIGLETDADLARIQGLTAAGQIASNYLTQSGSAIAGSGLGGGGVTTPTLDQGTVNSFNNQATLSQQGNKMFSTGGTAPGTGLR